MAEFYNKTHAIKELGLGDVVFDAAIEWGFIAPRKVPYHKNPRYHIDDIRNFARMIVEYNETPSYLRVRECEKLVRFYIELSDANAEKWDNYKKYKEVL